MNEKINGIFRKSVRLIQEKGKMKINNAVLLLDTNYGNFHLELKHDEGSERPVMMAQQYIAETLQEIFMNQHASGQLVVCSQCGGCGENLIDGLLLKCQRCQGGGQVILTLKER